MAPSPHPATTNSQPVAAEHIPVQMRAWWITLFLFLLITNLFSASAQADGRLLAHMEHRRWIAADGGPSQVGAIAQTRDGYLWLGTNDSLFRFDGFRFVRHETPDGKSSGIVSSLLAVENELWVGLRAGGVDVIDGAGMRRYEAGTNLPGGVIYSLARDRSGAIWAAADDGLARFDGTRWQAVSTKWNFPGNKARAAFVDRDGVLWAANENRLFYLPAGADKFVSTGLATDWVSKITQAPDGSIWLTERYSGKVHRGVLVGGIFSVTTSVMHASSNGLLFDRTGGLWVSTLGHGLEYVATPTGVKALSANQRFTSRDGLSADYIWPMLEDRDGNLWVGTSAGLDRFRPRTLMPAKFPADALSYALVAGDDGSVWAGTSNRSAMRLAGNRLDVLAMPAPTTCAMRDGSGTIWMAGPGGIWRSEGDALVFVTSLPGGAMPDSSVRAMARDAAGDLWVSINRLGLFKLQAGVWKAILPPSGAPSQLMPVTASADAKGKLWFGYRDNLLVTRDAQGERRWGVADGLDIGHVTAISHQGARTWIGGQRGIGVIVDDRFHSLRLPDNGLFNNIYAIIAVPSRDGGEDLWIHAKAGIFQLTAIELARAFADATHQIRYRSYDLMGGLANDPYQVLPLPTAVRSADGRLWFSTSSGVVWIDAERPRQDEGGPEVMIESVSADGALLPMNTPATLTPNAQRIVIDYTALSLSAPESLSFRYRLDGYDRDWHDAGRQREAVYTALGAGEYRFRVLAQDRDGLPSEREAVFVFTIPPVFYERPLFLFFVGALVFGLLWLFYRSNARRAAEHMRTRLEERHGERERIARELHDTLLQGVHGLMLRFQAVTQSIPDSHPARLGLEQALDRADQLVCEGRDRVRDLRKDTAVYGSLQDGVRALGVGLEHEVSATFSLTISGVPTSLQAMVRDEAYRIVHEAVVNAFMHAMAAHIDVTIDYAASALRIDISDDGVGINPAYLGENGRPDHWGLRGMHERAQRIGARLLIQGKPASGSRIVLSIPASLAYQRATRRWFHWRYHWMK